MGNDLNLCCCSFCIFSSNSPRLPDSFGIYISINDNDRQTLSKWAIERMSVVWRRTKQKYNNIYIETVWMTCEWVLESHESQHQHIHTYVLHIAVVVNSAIKLTPSVKETISIQSVGYRYHTSFVVVTFRGHLRYRYTIPMKIFYIYVVYIPQIRNLYHRTIGPENKNKM